MGMRGYCFDLYGTLLEYGDMAVAWRDWRGALLAVLRQHGYGGDAAAVEAACDGFFGRRLESAPAGGLTVYERRLARLYRELGVAVDRRRLAAATAATIPVWQRHLTLDPTAPVVLTELAQSARLALVTNFDHPGHVRRVLADTGLERFFDVVVISAEVGIDKPDPAIFDLPLEVFGLSPCETCHVGDDAVDVLAAVAAGLEAVRIVRGEPLPADDRLPPHRVVRSLAELLPG